MKTQNLKAARPCMPARVMEIEDHWLAIVGMAAARALAWACAGIARSRQRRALAQLDERLLRDIGHERAEIAREIAKPFWRR